MFRHLNKYNRRQARKTRATKTVGLGWASHRFYKHYLVLARYKILSNIQLILLCRSHQTSKFLILVSLHSYSPSHMHSPMDCPSLVLFSQSRSGVTSTCTFSLKVPLPKFVFISSSSVQWIGPVSFKNKITLYINYMQGSIICPFSSCLGG